MTELTVVSFNVRYAGASDGENSWPLRREATAAGLTDTGLTDTGLTDTGLTDTAPWALAGLQEPLAEQVDYLAGQTGATAIAAGRDDGRSAGEHAAVLVRGDGLTVESSEFRWLSETPDVPGAVGWDADLTRMATLVRLRVVEGGADRVVETVSRLGFANAHFDHRGAIARIRSAELLTRLLTDEPDRPWVVVGDLNDVPGSECLQVFDRAGFTSALPVDAGPTFHGFLGADRGQIDHILVGPGIEVLDAGVDRSKRNGRWPSDHYPIWARLRLPS